MHLNSLDLAVSSSTSQSRINNGSDLTSHVIQANFDPPKYEDVTETNLNIATKPKSELTDIEPTSDNTEHVEIGLPTYENLSKADKK